MRSLLVEHRVQKRLQRDVRYVPEEIKSAESRDFLTISTRDGREGILLYSAGLYVFSLQRRSPNKVGRIEPIICDICASWQRGTNSAVITFRRSGTHTALYLVCADLDCSLHVRGLTDASKISRVQLREQITVDGRIARLRLNLQAIVSG